jgi:hypothetical protein
MMPYVVGAGAATTPAVGPSGKINVGQVMQNATYSLPNLQAIGQQGAAAALAHLSPTAQSILNQPAPPAQPPMPGLPDINQVLSQGRYGFGAGAGAGAPAAAPMAQAGAGAATGAGAPPAQGAPPAAPIDWNALLQRQQQDAATQQMQAGISMGPPAPPAGGYAGYQPGAYGPLAGNLSNFFPQYTPAQ